MHLALYQPAIPPNTGNIGRLCVGLGAHLHLIGPIGFDLSEHSRRRAGLDYWSDLDWTLHDDPDAFLQWLGDRAPWLITKHGTHRFDRIDYQADDVLILGNENTGLPDTWHQRWTDRRIFIPIHGPVRSFNLANAAAIVLAQATVRTRD
ncbi:MAG: tRNA (cytidine(34)-2'-O)-methyltransferase [Phycisphaeraceae bacterium]|nr:tRNA (cytidine(34)-2'-O)-methyltransferase [Phycisphaeraceae bacterium]